jgi:hypothetical protein
MLCLHSCLPSFFHILQLCCNWHGSTIIHPDHSNDQYESTNLEYTPYSVTINKTGNIIYNMYAILLRIYFIAKTGGNSFYPYSYLNNELLVPAKWHF